MKRIWRDLPITEPLERRQAPLLLMLLPLMFVTSLLRSIFFFELDQASIGPALASSINTISLVSPAIALLLLFRGRFSAAALLAALSILLGVLLAITGSGLRRGGMLPLVFALPIVFTGLLLGWKALTLVCTLSCTAVIAIAILETQSSPLVAYTPSPEIPANMASIFVVVVVLLLSLLAWFRRDFRQELTSRLETEQTLRQSEVRFAAAFRANPAALAIARLSNGRFIDVNRSFAKLLGYRRDELIEQNARDLGIFPNAEEVEAFGQELRQHQAIHSRELAVRTKLGELRQVLCSSQATELDGETCFLTMIQDITERKQAEAMVRESQERLAGIVDSAMDAIISIDAAHTIIVFNPAAEQIFGCSASEALGQSLDRFIPPQFRATHAELIEGFRRSGVTSRSMHSPAIVTALRADGSEFPTEATISLVVVAGQPMYTVILRDITERKAAEQALVAERTLLARRVAERTADLSVANAELARAARLKDEFLANMSHELRTPLNGILGRSEALQEAIYGSVTPKQIEVLQGVTESGQHLLALINDILDLSKVEAGRLTLERETLDIDRLCTMSMRMVAQIATTKRITMHTSMDASAELINADERRLKQILVNLLSNSVKFTPHGGEVGLEVRSDAERQQVTFTVWDTGIGISEEDLAKLFQPFTQIDNRLNREHDGTGLGLALVRRLAEAHGGSVHVESTVGQGSRFSVILPWDPAEQRAKRLATVSAADTARPAIDHALVIEDSTTAAEQIARYLQELGAHVEVAFHGAGTVEQAINLKPDIIILDIMLPDEDGWEVLKRLKAEPRTRGISVIVVSVVDTPARARELGAAEVLLKPIDRAMFVAALRRATTRTAEPLVERALLATPQQAPRPRVLLAEDNQANIDMLFEYLRTKGYDVTVVRNGQEAIIRAQEEYPDIILMDIQMPGVDGLEAIRRIRADGTLAKTPIIAVTALALPHDRERCLEAGADEYLAKPVSLRLLVQTIEHLRGQRAQADSPTY